ncbi:MAG: ABC transporter substrate-binding protein [Burkholderiales bacterium]|nr:ABC transporter substrate-binding protein [Burkholderiales bacterium]
MQRVLNWACTVLLAAAATAASAQSIKIGVIIPGSGPFAIIGEEVKNGLEMYFAEINNTVAGRKVELIFEDDSNKPDVGLSKAKKLIERDGVQVVTGIVSSSVAYALRDYIAGAKVPMVMTVSGADGLTQHDAAPNIFRTSSSGSQQSHVLGEWLYKKKGFRRMIILAPNYAMGYEQTGGFARTFKDLGGKIVKTVYPPLGAPDYGPFLTSLDLSSADVIGVVFAGGDAIRFVKQFNDYGLKGKIPLVGSGLLTDDMVLQAQGDAAVGVITALNYAQTLDTPENKTFVANYTQRYKRTPTAYAEYSYVGGRVIKEAIEAVKGKAEDSAAMVAAMKKVQFNAPRGPFKFDDKNNPISPIYILEVEKQGGRNVNKVIDRFDNVSQFYTWSEKDYLAKPKYVDMANKWVD